MLVFKIHYTLPDGSEDWIIITGHDIEDIRAQAKEVVESRSATFPWSEELK